MGHWLFDITTGGILAVAVFYAFVYLCVGVSIAFWGLVDLARKIKSRTSTASHLRPDGLTQEKSP